MKALLTSLFLCFTCLASAVSASDFPNVTDTSFTAANGDRTSRLSIDIQAPVETVWRTLTTEAGWKAWTVKTAYIDLREGGLIETNYDADQPKGARQNIRNQIVALDEGRMLVFRNVQAPPTFPHAEAFRRIVTVIRLEPVAGDNGPLTRVTLSGDGYAEGAEYDVLYGFFSRGNAYSLEELKTCIEKMPPA